MANINFDQTVTGWNSGGGSATAVPSTISKTQFQSMLTGLTPQSDFFDRSIVVNESGTGSYDFRVESDTNTNMLLVDASLNAVGVGGSASSGVELKVHGDLEVTGTITGPVGLDALSAAVLAPSTDSIVFIDSANGSKKESVADFATAIAGTGISAASGVLSLGTTLNNIVTQMSINTTALSGYELSVGGDTYISHSLRIGDNTLIKNFGTSDTDVVNGVSLDGTLTASEFGSLLTGDPQGHIVMALQGNDANDGFHILVPGDPATSSNANKSIFRATSSQVVINDHSRDVDFRVESDANANMLIVDGGLNAVGIGNTPLTGYELTVSGQVLIGTNTLTGTGATDNSTGGTPFDTTYGPSGTHPAEVIISQGSNSTGTGLLVQSSAANNDATSIDNATVSIQGNGAPLLQLFDTNGTGNISHIYHSGNSFKVDWSMTNGDTTDTHNILKAMANRKLCQTVGTGSSDSGAMSVHDGVGTAASGDQSSQSISFYIDGSNLKVQYVASDGTTATTGTVCALS